MIPCGTRRASVWAGAWLLLVAPPLWGGGCGREPAAQKTVDPAVEKARQKRRQKRRELRARRLTRPPRQVVRVEDTSRVPRPAAAPRAVPRPREATAEGRVELLKPGVEPRVALVYRHAPGASRAVTVALELRAKLTSSGKRAPLPRRASATLPVELRADHRRAAGATYYRLKGLADPMTMMRTGGPRMAESTGRGMILSRRVTGWVILTGRGRVRDVGFTPLRTGDLYSEALFQVGVDALFGLMTRLPALPVGVGAEWRVRETRSHWAQLKKATSETRIRLVRRRGPRVTLEVTRTTTTRQQPWITCAQLPMGGKATLVEMVWKSRAKVELDPAKLGGRVTQTVSLRSEREISAPGKPVDRFRLTVKGTATVKDR